MIILSICSFKASLSAVDNDSKLDGFLIFTSHAPPFFLINKGEKKDNNSLEVLKRLNNAILNARDDLTNPVKNSFIIVMIPEEMAITETGRLLNELVKNNIPVNNIVVNQLYQDTAELCEFCKARREMQQKNLNKIKEIFGEKLNKTLIEIGNRGRT